uniref:hypothetical protein n=1 Tax=Psychrobacter sp. TaxID=56811 RepID=UPI0015EE691B|nr:hypothetical protein [Psychrobacter sp.]
MQGALTFLEGYQGMDKNLSGLFSKKPENNKGVDKAILDAVVSIGTRDKGNILILFSKEAYVNCEKSREEVKSYLAKIVKDPLFTQRTNSMDMLYSISDSELTIRNTVKSIKDDFAKTAEPTENFDRLVFSVFTKSRAELNEVASQCLSLENVNVYIV